jgi:chromosomal replication initiator protein
MARFYKVTVDEIKSERRGREVIQPRHEAMALIRESTPWSLPKIGKFFGGRDHTTVLSAIRRHQARIDAGTVGP